MQFSWSIFGVVFAGNALGIFAMYALQELDKNMPAANSIIPRTNQKFLRMENFYWMYSDLFGVALITNAWVHLAINKDINYLWWGLIIGIFAMVVAHTAFLSDDHKPDCCYPEIGKVSWTGILHLPYFAVGVGASAVCLWGLFSGELRGPVMWLAIAGGVFYIIFFILDIRSGHFEPLKKII